MKHKSVIAACSFLILTIIAISFVQYTKVRGATIQPQEKWHTEVLDNQTTNVSQLAFANENVYFTSGTTLYGVSEATGSMVFKKVLSAAFEHIAPIIDNGKIYVYNSGIVYAFDAGNDQLSALWSAPAGYGLTVNNGVVYTGSTGTSNTSTGEVYAYNASSGVLLWKQPHNCSRATAAYPVIIGDTEYLQSCYEGSNTAVSIFALNTSDGSIKWIKRGMLTPEMTPTDMFVNGFVFTDIYPKFSGEAFTAYNAADGSVAWTKTLNSGKTPISSVGNVVYISSGATIYALDKTTGNELWHQTKTASAGKQFFLTVVNSVVYAKLDTTVYAFDSNGNQLFEDTSAAANAINNEIFVHNDRLFIQKAESGHKLYAYSLTQGQDPTPTETQTQTPTETSTPETSPTSTPETSPTPVSQQKVKNPKWTGYVAFGTKDNPMSFSEVSASWKVQPVTCSNKLMETSTYWVGLGGIGTKNNRADIEQIGTYSACLLGKPIYKGVWDIITKGKNGARFIPSNYKVDANDQMSARVKALGKGKYLLELSNNTKQWTFSIVETGGTNKSAIETAECIVEAPQAIFSSPLVNFGTFTFEGCKADNKPIATGSGLAKLIMVNDKQVLRAEPSPIRNNDTFDVYWKHE